MIRRFKPGKKVCKNCSNLFEKNINSPLQPCCCILCILEWNDKQKQKAESKDWQLTKKQMKESLRTHGDWLKLLEKQINPIARAIDFGCPCISCNRHEGKPQAGHYHAVQSDPTIRYNLHNIHLQDYYCNVPKSGNITGYDAGLIRVYGQKYWEYVKFDLRRTYINPLKLSVPEIKVLIKHAAKIRSEIETEYRPPAERIDLRNEINFALGMYKEKFTLI
jgi:hypothetical protein